MGFNIKNNYGPNIEVNDGGKVTLVQGKDGLWNTVEVEETEYEEVKGNEASLSVLEDEEEQTVNKKIKSCIDKLIEEKVLKHLYDYTWVMEAMPQIPEIPEFKSPNSFISFLKELGIKKIPSIDSISKKQNVFVGDFPDLEFTDCDLTESTRRINVGKRFLSIYRSL